MNKTLLVLGLTLLGLLAVGFVLLASAGEVDLKRIPLEQPVAQESEAASAASPQPTTPATEISYKGIKARNPYLMKQAIFLVLNIPRFRHEIFSWNYGSELEPLFGQANTVMLQVRVQEAIRDALIQDDRITDVTGFSFARRGTEMAVSFVAETTEGNVESTVLFAPGTDTEYEVILK